MALYIDIKYCENVECVVAEILQIDSYSENA